MPHALLGDAKGPVADGPAAEGQGKAQMTTPDIRETITTLLTALLKDTGLTVPLHIKVTDASGRNFKLTIERDTDPETIQ